MLGAVRAFDDSRIATMAKYASVFGIGSVFDFEVMIGMLTVLEAVQTVDRLMIVAACVASDELLQLTPEIYLSLDLFVTESKGFFAVTCF